MYPKPAATPLPPYTPTHADPSVITAGLSGNIPRDGPAFDTKFPSLFNTPGGLGRSAKESKRSLLGGSYA